MTFEQLFESRLQEVVSEYSGKTLIILRGFDMPQVEYMMKREDRLLDDSGLLADGHLNLQILNEKWMDILTSIRDTDHPLVGFYDELLAISEFLPRITGEQIVILDNNLLSPWVPCCFASESGLKLFDHLQDEQDAEDDDVCWMSRHYGDVKLLDHERMLLLPITLESPAITAVPFWPEGSDFIEEPEGDEELIEAGSADDWRFCADLLRGVSSPAVFLRANDTVTSRQKALLYIAQQLGLRICFDELELYQERYVYQDKQFIPILKKYWGAAAAFRPLLFYKDPDRSRDTESITQGQIIAEIVDQCERAVDGDPFSNVFITAPTGSGKSILFQIPALYLAEKYNLVTIVVSPLIALMNDQVDQLQRERGISIAACINSTMTMEERMSTIKEIRDGKKSLIYLAPELLLTTQLQAFLGGRKVGLVVVDEAHTVTSWGRDFRSDYWFLGDFLKKARRDGLSFPVLCLTATAVYSGQDDVVNDTINELGLEKTVIHLGNVKRDNIEFDIHVHNRDEIEGTVDATKMNMMLDKVRSYAGDREKVLAYFPYRTQVDDIYNKIGIAERSRLRRYHGQLPVAERKMVEKSYKNGEAMGLFCTKAFGMGIDVGDIRHVIHYAPTGTLSDYVQEIGRAARNPKIQGVAHIDFFPGDLRYVRVLNGISEMRQYQLREMLKKLCAIYQNKKRRNLLIASETFEYLFKSGEVENRTKSGLMLLAKDLGNKYSFPVLIVRPKAMLSKNYVNVPKPLEQYFLKHFGRFATLQNGTDKRVVSTYGQNNAIEVYSAGNTYLVNMADLWENCYPDMAFGMFKKRFFEQEYRAGGNLHHFAPRTKVEIRYQDDYTSILENMERIVTAIQNLFGHYKNSEVKKFTLEQFEADLNEALGEKIISHDKLSLLLDVFTEGTNENAAYIPTHNPVRVLRKRRVPGTEGSVYFVSSVAYSRMGSFFTRQLEQCGPNDGERVFCRYYPVTQNKPVAVMPTLRILELLGFANYEISGGEKAEVFIRINDPDKLMRIAEGQYVNGVLQTIQERHRHNEALLSAFFSSQMTSDERWNLIEEYFLGNEDYVNSVLQI